MPDAAGDVTLQELRRAVQRMFTGFASLIDDPAHRQAARDFVHDAVWELDLTVRDEDGEVLDNVSGTIHDILDNIPDDDSRH
jgi:hypothetical protein